MFNIMIKTIMKKEMKKWNGYAVWIMAALLCMPLNACDDGDDEADVVQVVTGNDGGKDGTDHDGNEDRPGTPDEDEGHGELDLAGHEAVDLGLTSGTLWATMNVGAVSPAGYGKQYSWGETQEKSVYEIQTYLYCRGTYTTLTKYCLDMNYGQVDNKTVLVPDDDAAHVAWGGDWRMPTQADVQELLDECTCLWSVQSDVAGMFFIASNGNSVFFPASGYHYQRMWEETGTNGYYWTNTLSGTFSGNACGLEFDAGGAENTVIDRFIGCAVRPVAGK